MRILMIGPPGAGKGTQGALIAAHFDVPRIVVGDLLRDQVARRTDLGLAVDSHLGRGELVPDELVLCIVRQALELGMTANVAVYLRADDKELTGRLLARAALEHRSDDTEEVIRHRLEFYHRVTQPIIAWYSVARHLGVCRRDAPCRGGRTGNPRCARVAAPADRSRPGQGAAAGQPHRARSRVRPSLKIMANGLRRPDPSCSTSRHHPHQEGSRARLADHGGSLGRKLYETMLYWETVDQDQSLDVSELEFGSWRAGRLVRRALGRTGQPVP